MDEPCSALDPIATARIEDLMQEMKQPLHDRDRHPQHAAGGARQRSHRVLHDRGQPGRATGAPACWSSSADTKTMFSTPSDERTEQYVTGRFG